MMGGGQKATAVSPGGAGIGRGYLQICGAPARNFAGLAAQSGEGKRGKRREGGGLLIGAGAGMKRQALKWIKEGGMALSSGVIHGWRRKTLMWPDEWGPHVSEIREKIRDTDLVCLTGRGWLLHTGPKGCPGPFSYFIFFFSLFLFLFSYFFYNFCKNASNQLKPLSEIF
jgi:hypothetical protein